MFVAMEQKVIIVDFGSQYTQLIARRVRENKVYCEIQPFHQEITLDHSVKGLILSGGPCSVNSPEAPDINFEQIIGKVPVLAVCYGAQLLAKNLGGKVASSSKREYGRAHMGFNASSPLWKELGKEAPVWMSHADTILDLPKGFQIIGSTSEVRVAAFQHDTLPVYGVQFHPEVTHTIPGKQILANFLYQICHLQPSWTPRAFVESTVESLSHKLSGKKVVCGLSGGVDSSVASLLLHRAIGEDLHCIFVDNGLLRKNEFEEVMDKFQGMGLNLTGIQAQDRFYKELEGVSDPERKRKIIGKVFIDIFQEEANKLKGVDYLAQGTIYPDVIESVSVNGPSVTIKSHHNVGGLPEKMKLKVVEPLRSLFKDEVREVGQELGLEKEFISRHPFPGPGLAIRILSDVTSEKVALLQEADAIFIEELRSQGLYDEVWQAFAVLLPVQSVGVMGDERTYEQVVALRAVGSRDGMTADWSRLPYEFLADVSNKIINQIKGINRVVYDISSKPPATIEWE